MDRAILKFRLEELLQNERQADVLFRKSREALRGLLVHCQAHSPGFRARLAAAGFDPEVALPLDRLVDLPPLSRRGLQALGEELYCETVPAEHGLSSTTYTSGSTGEPAPVRRTQRCTLEWMANTLREHLWWKRDFRTSLLVMRAHLNPPRVTLPDWGPPVSLLYSSGPAQALSLSIPVQELADAVATFKPAYLTVYPNALGGILDEFRRRGVIPDGLRQVRCIGEVVTPALREAVRAAWAVEIADIYSSQEVGIAAIQCPESGLYHVLSDSLHIEVLDGQGRPVGEGQTGELVITDPNNYAMPLVRYATGDRAEVGPACPCGRRLATLTRIWGRSRNMMAYPDGSFRWPVLGAPRFREVAPVAQYQIVQRTLTELEVRLVVERPLSAAEEQALRGVICGALGHAFLVRFVYVEGAITRGAGGKFEDFICEIPAFNFSSTLSSCRRSPTIP